MSGSISRNFRTKNAILFAAQILGVYNSHTRDSLDALRATQRNEVLSKDMKLVAAQRNSK